MKFLQSLIAVRISAFLIVMGVVALATFRMMGSTVDADGVLHEPFFLIPTAWFLFAIGSLVGLLSAIRGLEKKP